jgi:SPX domain protein involved in polyphosphate accumulation
MPTGSIDPMLPRFECKYMIDPILVPEMRAFLRSFAVHDPYSEQHPHEDYKYTVCSLYLDSQDLRLYGQTVAGEKRRFKLRIRYYDDDPAGLVFPEIKRRENTILQKTRAAISRERVAALLAGQSADAVRGLSESSRQAVDSFQYFVGQTLAEPVLRVRYSREAWIAATGEPVRVTFDSNLMHAVTLGPTFSCTSGDWHLTPVSGIILEIKFTERFPFWVHEMVMMFNLTQRSVAKYVMSLDHVLEQGRGAALALGGFTLPPIGHGWEPISAGSSRRWPRHEDD